MCVDFGLKSGAGTLQVFIYIHYTTEGMGGGGGVANKADSCSVSLAHSLMSACVFWSSESSLSLMVLAFKYN